MPHDRGLGPSPFPGDDGTADPSTRSRLAESDLDPPTGYLRAVVALCLARILVPVVATATGAPAPAAGPADLEKETEMSVVMLQRPDGGRAVLGFTGLDAMAAWNPQARPVPVTVDVLAQAAVAEQAVALLIDAAGPHPLAVDGDILSGLAQGHRLVELPGAEFGWAQVVDGPGAGVQEE